MLREITHLRQSGRSQVKRWFSSYDMDLFVWFQQDRMPVRFQLCYNKNSNEKIISWNLHRGFHYYCVDCGETLPDQYKMTPLLLHANKQQDLTIIAHRFLAASENIDIAVADFIYARLMAYPVSMAHYSATHTDHPAR